MSSSLYNNNAGPLMLPTTWNTFNNNPQSTSGSNGNGNGVGSASCFVNQISIPPSPPPSPSPILSPTMFASPPPLAASVTATATALFPTASSSSPQLPPKRGRASISSISGISTTSPPPPPPPPPLLLQHQQQLATAVGGAATTMMSSSKEQQEHTSSSSVIDLSTDDDDDEDDQKMPAIKRQKTDTTAAFHAEQQQILLEVEERKQQEHNAMMLSNTGRAFKLVETLIQMHSTIMDHEEATNNNSTNNSLGDGGGSSTTVELVGQDDIVFLTERFLDCQQKFVTNNKPIHVSLAYHFTNGNNLQSIRQDGLLSHPERRSKNIHARRAAHFGDGVYTASNPYAFRHFGDTGLLCAILKGTVERVGPGGTSDANVDTAVGNKNRDGSPYTEETVLRDCCQVLPILRFSSTMIHKSGSLTYTGNALLWKFHEQVQKVLDKFFNRNVATTVIRVTPPDPMMAEPTPLHRLHHHRHSQLQAAALAAARATAAPPPHQPPPRPPPFAAAGMSQQFLNSLLGPQPQSQPPLQPQPQMQSAFASSAATSQALQNWHHQASAAAAPQLQAQAAAAAAPSNYAGGANTTTNAVATGSAAQEEKERFLMFTRVLLKYLETKDPFLHQKVKAIIKDCTERNKRGERGYESVTASMRERLKHVVSDCYWKRAESYLAHFLKQKEKAAAGAAARQASQSQPSLQLPQATTTALPSPTLQQVQATPTFATNPFQQVATVATITSPAAQAMTLNQLGGLNGPLLASPPAVPAPHVANHNPPPPIQREVLKYVAPKALVTAEDCCHRVRTLSKLEDCAICFTKLQSKGKVLKLNSCGCLFHKDCITSALQHDSKCPKCRLPVSEHPQGRSPSGTMTISHTTSKCSGFESAGEAANGSIQLAYQFPSGTQLPYHETPGQPYGGNRRSAYLPNNQYGRNLLKRFKYAWSKGLLFSVGTSLTTGRSGQVVWGSVHQKSSMSGGVGGHGFPDPNYFANANAELDSLGVPQHDKLNN